MFYSCKIIHQPTPQKLLWVLRLHASLRSFLTTPYSPDLAPSICFKIWKLTFMEGIFWSSEGVIDAVDYLGDQKGGFYFEGISKLEQRCSRCIEAKRDYTERKVAHFLLLVVPKVQGPRTFLLYLVSYTIFSVIKKKKQKKKKKKQKKNNKSSVNASLYLYQHYTLRRTWSI